MLSNCKYYRNSTEMIEGRKYIFAFTKIKINL